MAANRLFFVFHYSNLNFAYLFLFFICLIQFFQLSRKIMVKINSSYLLFRIVKIVKLK